MAISRPPLDIKKISVNNSTSQFLVLKNVNETNVVI